MKAFILLLPALLVFAVLSKDKEIVFAPAKLYYSNNKNVSISPVFPKTKWGSTQSCSNYINEQEEFKKAFDCASRREPFNVFKRLILPRCFVISANSSSDIYSNDEMNFLPAYNSVTDSLYAIVGYYDSATSTIFIVENAEIDRIYRHELQHYFLDQFDAGSGHHQDIWTRCEPEYYSISEKEKALSIIKKVLK